MRAGLRMDRDDIGTGLGEGFQIRIGRAIIKWTSNILVVRGRMALMMSGPKLMFGTKCPSITSQ